MKRRWIVGGLVAASLVASAGPAMASRDRLGGGGTGWEWAGGHKFADSVDGPKSSNAYQLDGTNGSYVFYRGYWDMPLSAFSGGFSYKADAEIADGDGSPRISIELAPGAAKGGDVVYLDPYWCPSGANAKGWATTDFMRAGSSCTISTSFGVFTGTDASVGDPLDPSDDVAATSAWSAVLAARPAAQVYIAYLVADWEGTSVVDRVRFGGAMLSQFATDDHSAS